MKRHLLTLLFFFLLLDSSLSIPLEPTIGNFFTGFGRAVAGTFKNIRNSIRSDEDATKARDQARDYLLNHVPDLVGSQPQPGASQFRCGGFHYFLSPTQGRNWFSDRTNLTYRFNPKIQDPFAQVLRDSFRRWSEELSLPLREKRYDEHDYADITIELYNFPDNMVVGDSRIVELIPSNFDAAVGRVGYIRLDDNKNWGVLNIDIDTVVMHQLGHLLGLSHDLSSWLNSTWEKVVSLFSQTFESASSTDKEKPNSSRGIAAAIEDSSIDFGDFFKGPLPGKFLKLLGFLALSRLGVYIPLGGVNREAFVGNLDQNSLLSTLDSFSGGGIGRLGICSLGIVPFINAQIVFQLLAQVYPKLQDLQKREGEAGRKKVLQYTRYASVGFAIVQAIGQVLFLRLYVNDFSSEWVLSSIILLTLGSVFTTYIGERITDLKLGNGTSLLIFTNIISYLPASFGRTIAQAFNDANYIGLATIIVSFFLLVVGIVYVQEAERKIPLNYASRFTSKTRGLEKSAYLPFKVNSSGVMPIIFSTSSLALPGTLARFTGLNALKQTAVALNPGGSFYVLFNILLIAFFNYYYTFLQLDPDDVSEQLKRQGASIPLVRPGRSTAAFIKTVLSRISVLGSTFLAILAAGPAVVEQTTHLTAFRGFAGTSILILVGCATDTARKVQAEIISQKYKNIEFYDFDKY